MGQPDDKPGFIEEALRHRQIGTPDDEALVEPVEPEPVEADPTEPDLVEPELASETEPKSLPEPARTTAFADWPVADRTLVDEALKKAGVLWVHGVAAPGGQAYWHVWVDDAIYLLTGGPEQPDGGLGVGEEVRVVVASKDSRARLLSFGAAVSVLEPVDDDWEAATTALAGARLNLPDVPGAPARWATDSEVRVIRLTPTSPEGSVRAHSLRTVCAQRRGRPPPPPPAPSRECCTDDTDPVDRSADQRAGALIWPRATGTT